MSQRTSMLAPAAEACWVMPVLPDTYDRRPLSAEERRLLAAYVAAPACSADRSACTRAFHRLLEPLHAVRALRRRSATKDDDGPYLVAYMIKEMHRRQAAFWQWSSEEWVDTLSARSYRGTYYLAIRASMIDVAYLLCAFDRLHDIGRIKWVPMAYALFGQERVATQVRDLMAHLQGAGGLGYSAGRSAATRWRQAVCAVLLYNRDPRVANLTRERLAAIAARVDPYTSAIVRNKFAMALEKMGLLAPRGRPLDAAIPGGHPPPEDTGVPPLWFAWCMAWRERSAGSLAHDGNYVCHILATGRWLAQNAPDVTSPEQWTEDLALTYRAALVRETIGRYSGPTARARLASKGLAGKPLGHKTIAARLLALRRFFNDLQKTPHAVAGAPARKIPLRFKPQDSLAVPAVTRRAMDAVEPRDIDQAVWRKLAGAAARLDVGDLPRGHQYPLTLYRAVALLWITTARRPNELQRLRVDCVRRDWDHGLIDEDGVPIEPGEAVLPPSEGARVSYLRIPTNKYGGEFWIWIPTYTADAIDAWKEARGQANDPLYDDKDREYADLLFCHRDKPLGDQFLNEHLIPVLCRAAGDIPTGDAKGRYTGHRGRSTRITLLRRCGMGLEDLAAYAGHKDTATIRHYARTDPLQLHRTVAKADTLSTIIEGLIDLGAAAAGRPAVRWFLGYDPNGLPQFCGLPAHHTCPHRMDCVHCGLYIGGEAAKLLGESEDVQRIWAEIPMTPAQQLLTVGEKEAAEQELAKLAAVAPPVGGVRPNRRNFCHLSLGPTTKAFPGCKNPIAAGAENLYRAVDA